MHPDPAQLRPAPLFEGLDDDHLERISGWSEIGHADAGEPIVHEGATGFFFYVIVEGTAEVRHDGTVIATLGPGDHFGEMAIEDAGIRRSEVTAAQPLTLSVMFGTDFLRMEQEMPAVAARVRAAMEERLQYLDDLSR